MRKSKDSEDTETISAPDEGPDMEDNGVTRTRSKVVYEFLAGFLCATGADRIYLGAYMSGFIKLGMFLGLIICFAVVASAGFFSSNFADAFAISGWAFVMMFIIIVVLGTWVFVDYIIALVNGLSRSNSGPWSMGADKVKWMGEKDINAGFYLTIFFLFLNFFLFPVVFALVPPLAQ
jgi:hypothetical protein